MTNHKASPDEKKYSHRLKYIIITIILLNAIDIVLTVIGVQRLNLEEGNPVLKIIVHDVAVLVVMKLIFITSIFVFFISHLTRHHYHFAKSWEDTAALIVGGCAIFLYAFVIINNIILIF